MNGSNNLVELNFNHIVADLLAIRIQLLNLVNFEQQFDLLQQLERKLADPLIWDQHELIKQLSKEKSKLENRLLPIKAFAENVINVNELFNMAKDLEDLASIEECQRDLLMLRDTAKKLEFECMFGGELDQNNAFLDLQAGSGGTEAQDWAEILLRMYLRWAESRKFQVDIMEISAGEVAGIKSATIKISGSYAYGWLRYETGVHRLVRKSPFDSGNRRHTSFAAVFVYPEVDDEIQVDINPSDLKVDTYRASGAGGQHVNRTDSAVRITHIPSGIVVQCQSDRSQHKNKSYALKQLKAKLYDLEIQAQNQEKRKLEEAKTDIGWGNQIRSYVLDQSRIKDLRSNLEIFDPQQVLDGGIDPFLESNLKKLNFKSKDK